MRRTIFACVIIALIAGATTATAATLITGSDIKNGSITGADIKNPAIGNEELKKGAVIKKKLSANVRELLEAPGPKGPQGSKGDKGDKGNTGAPGAPGRDALTVITAPGRGFSASNSLAQFTSHGVVFGPFTNSATTAGSVQFEGDDVVGKPVRDIAELTYSAGSHGTNDEPPWLRILTDVNGDGFNFNDCCEPGLDDHEFAFIPSTQAGGGSAGTDGRLIKYETTQGTWVYDAPLESGTWDALVNLHGDEPIFQILITSGGLSAGTTDAFLNSFSYELAGLAPVEVSFSE